MATAEKNDSVNSIAKAALLLRTLSTFAPAGVSLTQICELTQLPKATAHRLLASMLAQRLVERPAGTRAYKLGADIFAFGLSMNAPASLQQQCRPSLERLASATQATVYLGVRSGYDMLCLDRVDGDPGQPAHLLNLHDRWPLGIGSFSLALLAYLPTQDVDEIIAFNQRRVRDEATQTFERIRQSMEVTRRNGYAKRATRSYKGLSGIAVPVFDGRRYPIASLCAVSDKSRMSGTYLASVVKQLQHEAALITAICAGAQMQTQHQERWRLAVRDTDPARASV